MFTFLRRLLRRRRPAGVAVRDAPLVSRAGLATRTMRPGDQRHRPTQADHDLAWRLGVRAHDPSERRF